MSDLIPSHLKFATQRVTTLEYIFTWCVNIRSVPQKGLLRVLAEYAKDDKQKKELREVVSIKKKKEYEEFISTSPSLLELLQKYDACIPTVEHLLSVLPKNPPRNYSLASSPLCDESLHFAFSCFRLELDNTNFFPKKIFKGLCTSWLEEKDESEKLNKDANLCHPFILDQFIGDDVVPIIQNKNNYFTLPESVLSGEKDLPHNLVFVASGTGVSPFRGFLRHLNSLKKQNPQFILPKIALVFGCRDRNKDYLYRDEFEKYLEDGVLSHIFNSFSRENNFLGDQKRYVDKVIMENTKFFNDFVDNDHSFVFVCGEANGMVKSVTKAFEYVFQQEQNLEPIEAEKKVSLMKENKKFVLDIWA